MKVESIVATMPKHLCDVVNTKTGNKTLPVVICKENVDFSVSLVVSLCDTVVPTK